jgi:hypothetical protein
MNKGRKEGLEGSPLEFGWKQKLTKIEKQTTQCPGRRILGIIIG